MRKITFALSEKDVKNKIFIKVKYQGGDADYTVYETYLLEGVSFDKWEEQIDIINQLLDEYEAIQKIQYNNGASEISYDKLKTEYNATENMLGIYEECPGDATVDGQWRCIIDGYELIGYDSNGLQYKGKIQTVKIK